MMLVILRTVCNGEVLLSVTVVQRHKGCSLTQDGCYSSKVFIASFHLSEAGACS